MSTAETSIRKRKTPLKAVKIGAQKRVIPRGDQTKPRWWRVTVGKRFTGTKKERRFFATERAANEFINQTLEARQRKGHVAFSIPNALAVEAVELARKLEPHDASLTDAVSFFLRHRGNGQRRTFNDLLPEYLRTKAAAEYRRAQETALKVFAREFGRKPVDAIFAPAIEKWLNSKGWKPLNRRNYIRDVSMFFRWAELHEHVAENPMRKVTRPKVQQKTPDIFTVAEAEKLLTTAAEKKRLGLLGMYAVAFFSGVRIEEIGRMRWEMVAWDEGEIRLPAEITKTGMPRNIEIVDALRSWIEDDAPTTGTVVSPTNLRLRREKLFELAEVPRKRNALRHSFASYHAALHRDPGALQMLLGQQTPSVLFKHYIQAVPRVNAEAFFALRRERASDGANEITSLRRTKLPRLARRVGAVRTRRCAVRSDTV